MSAEDQIAHGESYGAAQKCYRANGKTCPACRKVWTAYAAEWRATRPIAARQAKNRDLARQRALWRLARLYPAAFQRLVTEEAAKSAAKGRA